MRAATSHGSRAAPPAVVADAFTFRPAGADGPLPLQDVTFSCGAAETLLIAGPTGAGKTTLLRVIAGLGRHYPDPACQGHLEVRWQTDAGAAPGPVPDPMPGRVGLVQQEAGDGLLGLDVYAALAFPLEETAVPASEAEARIEAALDAFGLGALAARDVATLSGGERRRVALAGILALDPPLVLLDEPLAGLDPEGTRTLLADLHRLQHRRTCILAEHRIELVRPLVDQTLHLLPGDVPSTRPPLPVPRMSDPGPRIVVRGLEASRGGRPLWHDARFVLGPGVWGLLGRNGTGKTTLLETLAGLLRPDKGEVTVDGVPVWNRTRRGLPGGRGATGRRERVLRQRLQVAFQDPREGFHARSCLEEVAAPLRAVRDLDAGQARIRARDALEAGRLADLAERSPFRVSGGEGRLLQLTGTLAVGPRVWFLDEPTHGLDAAARDALTATLQAFRARGGLVVVATHEPDVLPDGTRFLFLPGDGTVVVGDDARPGAPGPRDAGYTGGETVREVLV